MYDRLLIVVLLLIVSCGTTPGISGFDSDKWKEDDNGCNGVRSELVEEIIDQKEKLLGNSQTQVTKLFGKPERHELYSRNKKSFVYYVHKGPGCENESDNPDILVLRFDALGRVKEVVLHRN